MKHTKFISASYIYIYKNLDALVVYIRCRLYKTCLYLNEANFTNRKDVERKKKRITNCLRSVRV